MRDVLRKWTPQGNCVKYQNFPTLFGLSLSLECSGKISRQSINSTYPINSLKVDVFLQKSNVRFQLVKVHKQLAPRPEIITPSKTANQWKNRTSSVYDNRSQFAEKSIALQHIFYLAQCSSIQDDHLIMGKEPKVKAKAKAKPTPKGFSNALDLQQMPSLLKAFARPSAFVAFGKVFFSQIW